VYDIVIRGGQVIDGSGGPAVIADVGINGRRIAAVGPELGEGRLVVNAESRVVTRLANTLTPWTILIWE
jgi:N-acyl-D-aspartate/D-glutamate deacylase